MTQEPPADPIDPPVYPEYVVEPVVIGEGEVTNLEITDTTMFWVSAAVNEGIWKYAQADGDPQRSVAQSARRDPACPRSGCRRCPRTSQPIARCPSLGCCENPFD